MIDKEIKLPFYARTIFLIIGLFALLSMLYIARSIIIPLVFSTIIAILLHPVVKFFIRHRINRIVAIILTLFLTFLIFSGLGALIFSQVSQLSESWPVLVERLPLFSTTPSPGLPGILI